MMKRHSHYWCRSCHKAFADADTATDSRGLLACPYCSGSNFLPWLSLAADRATLPLEPETGEIYDVDSYDLDLDSTAID